MCASSTKRWFDEWADDYDDILPRVREYQKLVERIVEYARVRNGDTVLDIGCGTGYLSLKLMDVAACRLVAIDLSSEMLKVFREKLYHLRSEGNDFSTGIELGSGDCLSLPFKDETFDVITSSVVMHHIRPERKQIALSEIHRVLKPGGRFLLGELNFDATGDLNDSVRLERVMAGLTKVLSTIVASLGAGVLDRMFDNAKRHLLCDDEYAITIDMWEKLSIDAGFNPIWREVLPSGAWGFLCLEKATCTKEQP
ncbi:hypothetical protein DRN98_06190 [Methanosarcinales archaeon]|nr:MAG: hypothetical protein DRN98_06190 [Methanosarcinales archaeon]